MNHGIYLVTKPASKRYRATLYRGEVWVNGTRIYTSAWSHDKVDVLRAARKEAKRCAG